MLPPQWSCWGRWSLPCRFVVAVERFGNRNVFWISTRWLLSSCQSSSWWWQFTRACTRKRFVRRQKKHGTICGMTDPPVNCTRRPFVRFKNMSSAAVTLESTATQSRWHDRQTIASLNTMLLDASEHWRTSSLISQLHFLTSHYWWRSSSLWASSLDVFWAHIIGRWGQGEFCKEQQYSIKL